MTLDKLNPGWHTLTLEAADSDEFVSQDSVEVFMGYEIYLPLVMRESQVGLAKSMMRGW
ncbi:MAG: hypothetical protein ABIG63_06935 [Chloroflexota bacterium]